MNPLTNVRNITKLNERELELGIPENASWHQMYKNSSWIFFGGLDSDLTEGDVICVFSQYGEVVNIHLIRDRITGRSKGFGFLCYDDQRSTILAVDNLNAIKLCGRTLRVDHCENYKIPNRDKLEPEQLKLLEEGCGPKPIRLVNKEQKLLEDKKKEDKRHDKRNERGDDERHDKRDDKRNDRRDNERGDDKRHDKRDDKRNDRRDNERGDKRDDERVDDERHDKRNDKRDDRKDDERGDKRENSFRESKKEERRKDDHRSDKKEETRSDKRHESKRDEERFDYRKDNHLREGRNERRRSEDEDRKRDYYKRRK